MSTFRRTITFHSNDLGANVHLVLTFDSQPMHGIYKDYFPTAWKIIPFGDKDVYSDLVVYESQLCFLKPQADGDVLNSPSTWRPINLDQSTDLTKEGDNYHFSPPKPGETGLIQAWNKTGSIEGIGLGFDDKKTIPPKTVLFWESVGTGSNVTAQFTPVLKAYITSNYQENQILRGAIQTPAIWEQDLAKLSPTTRFTLSRDSSTGVYKITQDHLAAGGSDYTPNVIQCYLSQ